MGRHRRVSIVPFRCKRVESGKPSVARAQIRNSNVGSRPSEIGERKRNCRAVHRYGTQLLRVDLARVPASAVTVNEAEFQFMVQCDKRSNPVRIYGYRSSRVWEMPPEDR